MIRRQTWIVLGVFVVVLAGGLFWQQTRLKNEPESTPTMAALPQDEFLFDLTGASIVQVKVERVEDQKVVELKRVDDAWQLLEPAGQETDSAAVESIVSSLLTARIVAKPTGAADLAVLGLQPPVYRVLVTLQNNEQVVINIGNLAGTGAGYYVLSSARVVYVVNQFGLSGLIQMVDAPPVVPTPTLEPTPEAAPETTLEPTAVP
jgi:hypothetical protein